LGKSRVREEVKMTILNQATSPKSTHALSRFVPMLGWLRTYPRDHLASDLLAGVIVAVMLVPQSMAYALLAGLPPQVGLYASIAPLLIYGVFGSSRTLAVGPVAIVSLLTATGLSAVAGEDVALYITAALTLALMVGLIQLAMGLARLGFLVNFLSHPVLSGFTTAAALVIGSSQLKHILGISVPNSEQLAELLGNIAAQLGNTNPITLTISILALATLWFFRSYLGIVLAKTGISPQMSTFLTRTGALVVVVVGTLLVWGLGLDRIATIKIVGAIPAGLPTFTLPPTSWTLIQALFPIALTISLVGFMESISVATSLASKRRQKVDPDQELVALGLANLGASVTGGYPVTGGLSRSVVNFSAGAMSGLASIFTAIFVALTALFLTPLFFYLPQAILAAIVIIAVTNLLDFKGLRHIWQYSKADATAWMATFVVVLATNVETGILAGVGVSLALFLWRTSKPHVAVVGRVGDTEIYRNVLRYQVQTCPHVLAVRVDESLYFANTKFLENTVLRLVAEQPAVKHFVLIGTAINSIDSSALETLLGLIRELKDAGVTLHLAAMKGPVLDRLNRVGFLAELGEGQLFLSTHDAMVALDCTTP
jgi:sulfate permease, SulP family